MNTVSTNTIILVATLIVVTLGAIGWALMKRQRSLKLQHRFGPEYDRTVRELGGKTQAESELSKREQRVAGLEIIPISAADAARFSNAWSALEGRFVDNPKGVLAEADLLVRELMAKRGYPMATFQLRAADISVDHPGVVKNYRAAQAIAARDARGEADTEELRKAVVHYRTLFNELLGVAPTKLASARVIHGVPVRS
jgi:hypothetical protein